MMSVSFSILWSLSVPNRCGAHVLGTVRRRQRPSFSLAALRQYSVPAPGLRAESALSGGAFRVSPFATVCSVTTVFSYKVQCCGAETPRDAEGTLRKAWREVAFQLARSVRGSLLWRNLGCTRNHQTTRGNQGH